MEEITKAYVYFNFEASWLVTDTLVPKLSGHWFSAARYHPRVSSTTTCTQVNVSNLHTRYSPLLSHRPCEDGPIGRKHEAQSTVGCHPHLFGSCVDFRLHEYYLQGHRCNNVTCKTIFLVTPRPNWGPDQPQTSRARVCLFLWQFSHDLSGMTGPTSSSDCYWHSFQVRWWMRAHSRCKVNGPSRVEDIWLTLRPYISCKCYNMSLDYAHHMCASQ